MPRDREAWNKALGKTFGFLQRRNSPANSLDAPTAYINSLDASATGLGVSDIGNSTRSTSNSQAASRAIVRARQVVLQALNELDQSGDDGSCEPPQWNAAPFADNVLQFPILNWSTIYALLKVTATMLCLGILKTVTCRSCPCLSFDIC